LIICDAPLRIKLTVVVAEQRVGRILQ